jgi:hypothetical protein
MSSFFDCGACVKLGENNILMKLNKIISKLIAVMH